MQFYDATNKRAICQEIDRLCDTTDTSYSRLDKTARVNDALEDVVGLILDSDGRWEWDDTNRTDFPIGTSDLVSGQQDYALDVTHLKILGVSVKDVAGRWYKLLQFDPDDLSNNYGPFLDRAQFLNTAGRPLFYDLLGNSIFLYPAPDNGVTVTLTGGLKVYFQRTAVLFTPVSTTAADTTVPGFASMFHPILAYKAALPYCQTYKKDRVPMLLAEIARLEKALVKFYSNRNKDEQAIVMMRPILFR